MCGKLQNLELEGNAALKIVRTRLVEKLMMIHFGFRVFDVNWLVGTLRKGIQSRGHSTDSRFLHLRNIKSFIYIYIYCATYSCNFSLSNLSHIQNKPTVSDNTL